MKKIYEWLKENPRPLKELEYELLEFGINFYHIISLLWEQTTRSHTESFLIWKTREMLEILLNNVQDGFKDELVNRISEARNKIQNIEKDALLGYLGCEIEGSQEYSLSVEFKMAIVLKLLNEKGILDEQIFAKYQN